MTTTPLYVIACFTNLGYIVAVATCILAPFYLYAVICKSPDHMTAYRNLLLTQFVFSALTTVSYASTLPMVDDETFHWHLYGVIEVKSDILAAIVAIIITYYCNVNTDLLLIMLINRYDTVSKNVVTYPRSRYFYTYTFICITNVAECYTIIFRITNLYFPYGLEIAMVTENFIVFTSALYHLSRIIGLIAIISLNVQFEKNYENVLSPVVARLHKMLTKSIIANLISALICTRLPLLLVLAASISGDLDICIFAMNTLGLYISGAFLVSMILTLHFVKPYWRYIVRSFKRKNNVVTVGHVVFVSNVES
uniref:G protein-coupled receptor n=1 Tax=Panagrellus redivivus TaxID=6233 RepID=A0A7E4UZP0_PANRE